MQLLETYDGAVLFVDILGFSALTSGQIALQEEDTNAWLGGTGHPPTNEFFAAAILVELRDLLKKLQWQFPDVKVAQLSDCFFAWSNKVERVVEFAHQYMFQAIERGLLSRGGMAQGSIIETNQAHELGRLILGQAVTVAVSLEKNCKGCRILVNEDLRGTLLKESRGVHTWIFDPIQPSTNTKDTSVNIEFQWYLSDALSLHQNSSVNLRPTSIERRSSLQDLLLKHPKFGWNRSAQKGREHIDATVYFLSKADQITRSQLESPYEEKAVQSG